MASPILSTKLFIPATRPELVPRQHLIKNLNDGLYRKLTLISAPAGFGKTTLVIEWLHSRVSDASPDHIAWLSLDEADNESTRFLMYFIAALNQTGGDGNLGTGVIAMLQSPQPPPIEAVLTLLINEIAVLPDKIIFILDDYHSIHAQPIHDALSFVLENQPQNLHMVITTREDPLLPLSRLRTRSQLTELRAADLRFDLDEATKFLNEVMGLKLSAKDVAALEKRTEGWIAGLQLAAISLQGQTDSSSMIQSFTGSNRLVLDYLVEEVLNQQSQKLRDFLLQTAILDRMTGPLCDAITGQEDGQETLEMLDRANLFIISLDNDHRWYRYHHLFADFLRQSRHHIGVSKTGNDKNNWAAYHMRASQWFEEHDMQAEAFQHAVAADDFERASRLAEGDGMPLHFRGVVTPLLDWLETLPTDVLDGRPSLWVIYASVLLIAGQPTNVEQKIQAADIALEAIELDAEYRNWIGLLASTRAALSALVIFGQSSNQEEKLQAAEAALQESEMEDVSPDLVGLITPMGVNVGFDQKLIEIIIAQSRRALEYAHPNNLITRVSSTWMLGLAYQLLGDRGAACQAYAEVITKSQTLGNNPLTIAAAIGLGQVQEADGQLYQAAEGYRRALQWVNDLPMPVACEAHLGLARIHYQWNDLDTAEVHGQQSAQLSQQIDIAGRYVLSELFLARLAFAQGELTKSAEILQQAEQLVRQHNLVEYMFLIAAEKIQGFLQQGDIVAAAELAKVNSIPISQAQVFLAQYDPSNALKVLDRHLQIMDARSSQDEWVRCKALQAVTLHALGNIDEAMNLLADALVRAEPGGYIRIFVDEGAQMQHLLNEALQQGISTHFVRQLLVAFRAPPSKLPTGNAQLPEPLSQRELEVLQLMAEGMTNPEIAEQLYLTLNTVKAHSRNIYGKLDVHNRTQAITKAQLLGLLPPMSD